METCATRSDLDHTLTRDQNGVRTIWNVPDIWKAAEGIRPKVMALWRFEDALLAWLLQDQYRKGMTFADAKDLVAPLLVEHLIRCRDADDKWPIIIGPDDIILDGFHRLLKAWVSGAHDIRVQQLIEVPAPIQITTYDEEG